jgi:hypothetical protein
MTRRRWVAVVVVGALVLAGAGLGAAQFVKSPAQAAADSKAPAPDVLEAPVEKRVLRHNIVVRGTAAASRTSEIAPAAGGADGVEPVVTKLPLKPGATVREGTVLMEVSGRPVIALRGATPVYRDLKPGTRGEDVRQLQAALRSLGHGTGGDASGAFGAGTKAALAALYRALGYDPRPAQDDDGEALRSARDAVLAARRALEDARTAAAQASARPSAGGATNGTGEGNGTGAADGSGGTDQDGGTGRKATPTPGVSPSSEPGPQKPGTSAQGVRGALLGEAATADDAGARRAVVRAQEDLARAEERYAEAKAKDGPMLPAAEVVYLSAFPARVGTVSVAVGAHVNGTAMTVSSGDLLVTSYLQDNQKNLVRAGADAEVVDETSGRTYRGTVSGVASRRAEDSRTGSGGDGSGAHSATGDGARSPEGDAGGSGGQDQAASGYRMTIQTRPKLPASLSGADLRVTIEAGATAGPVLVVPVTAVSAGADGRRAVTVVRASGAQTRVEVRTGAQADGYVEVRPAAGQKLAEGDRVVTGASRAGGDS